MMTIFSVHVVSSIDCFFFSLLYYSIPLEDMDIKFCSTTLFRIITTTSKKKKGEFFIPVGEIASTCTPIT